MQSSALSDQDALKFKGLEDIITYSLLNYSVPPGTHMVPKRPMRMSVRVVFRPEMSSTGTYLCDLLITAYRPIYASEEETIIFASAEEAVPVDPYLIRNIYGGKGELPSEPFLLRLHYLATLSLLLYSDSFDLNGGDAYLEHLKTNASAFAKSFSDQGNSSSSLSPSLSSNMPTELDTDWGKAFRELWVLFHLEVLDTGLKEKGNEQTFGFILKEWKKLGTDNHIPSLMLLLRDTKKPDISTLIRKMGAEEANSSAEYIDYLFPAQRDSH